MRFILTRATDSVPARDTTVQIGAGQDSVVLELTVPTFTVGETFVLDVELRDTAGVVVFRGGPISVTPATGGAPTPQITVPIQYVGPGSNAISVRIIPPDLATLLAGDSLLLVAEALDAAGEPIPATPVAWESLDTARAHFPSAGRGLIRARELRGSVQFIATLLTGPADTGAIAVQPSPTSIAAQAGDGQTATVDSLLAQPLIARITAADGLGVAGIWVRFGVTGGGGSVSPDSALTNDSGDAQSFWRLGGAAGTQTLTASTPRLAGQTAPFSATGAAGAPTLIAIEAGEGQTALAGAAVTVAPAVLVTDANGNPVPGAAVTFEILSGGGAVTGATPGSNASGVATVGSWTLGSLLGTNTLRAWLLGPGGDGDTLTVTFTATGLAGLPTTLTIVAGDAQTDTAGATLADSSTVEATDAGGNPVPGVAIAWAVTAGGGALSADTTLTDVNGLARVHWTVGTVAGAAQELVAEIVGGADSATFSATVTPATATQLAFTASPTDAFPAAVLDDAVVEVHDQFGNVVASDNSTAVTVSIESGSGTASAILGGTLTRTIAAGAVTFDDLTIDRAGTGYQLHAATVAGLTPATGLAFDIVAQPGAAYWIAAISGSWNDPTAWSTGAVPTSADTVLITVPGAYVVTVGSGVSAAALALEVSSTATLSIEGGTLTIDGAATIDVDATLAVSSGTLAGAGTVLIEGTLLWSGGQMVGTGETAISSQGAATLTGSGTKGLDTRTFRNAGLVTWDGGWWQLNGGNPTVVVNEVGATLDAVGGRRLTWGATPAGKLFQNDGTFLAEADTIEVPWTQLGEVTVA
ncbi:MAG TPA: Ig-like domain-containing protein, partial [Gemmatimonadales bacterium]